MGVGRVMAEVVAVCRSETHTFSKDSYNSIELIKGIGVRGDAHAGETVQHFSRVKADPDQPNLRQVHLIHEELFNELAKHGFNLSPGDLGENITKSGIDLLSLPQGARLHLGADAVVEITGLRNPCKQIEHFRTGLLERVVSKDGGHVVRKTGVMGIVLKSGVVETSDRIRVDLPDEPQIPLEVV